MARTKSPDQVLADAIDCRNVEMLRHAIANGARVNRRSEGGETPLMAAIGTQFAEGVRELINGGANANLQDAEGWSAADYAVRDDVSADVISIMAELLPPGRASRICKLKHELNAAPPLSTDANTLLGAAFSGDVRLIESLPSEQLVDVRDQYGKTPLMYAGREQPKRHGVRIVGEIGRNGTEVP